MIDKLALSRRAMLAGAAGLATVSLAGTAEAAPKRGGRLIYARYADSLELDPIWTELNVDIWVMGSIYETLLLPEGQGVKPGLATKWDYSDGGKTLTLTLRPGVKFSDGTPLKASDVKWSLDRARNPKNGPWVDQLGSIEDITSTEPGTIVLKLKHPDATLLPALAMFNTGVLPQAKYEAVPAKDDQERYKKFAENPVGTGPFMLAEWQRNQRMLLKRNPYYWGMAPDGKPYPLVDELEFPIIPDDATRLLKLKAGEVHGTEFIPFARVAELQADPNLRVELWPSTYVIHLTFSVREKLTDGTPNPLSNKKVRQALNYAVNKDAVIAITTRGLGKPMTSFMSAATPLHVGTTPLWPYDLAKAKALLKEAGFESGFPLLATIVAGRVNDISNITTIQQMWAAIGVKLTIEQMDNPTRAKKFRAGDYQIVHGGWTDDIADPSEIAGFYCYAPSAGSLHSGYEDKHLNELFVASNAEIDPAKRAALYKEMQDIYNEAATIVPLYEQPYAVCWRKEVKGFLQIPLGNNYFFNTAPEA
jgi:peptide/nickel transport system substrate-binding protein